MTDGNTRRRAFTPADYEAEIARLTDERDRARAQAKAFREAYKRLANDVSNVTQALMAARRGSTK